MIQTETKAKKPTKYVYCRVLQGNYGYGWNDLIWCDKNDPKEVAEFRDDVKTYRQEERGVSFRVVERRMPRGETRPW